MGYHLLSDVSPRLRSSSGRILLILFSSGAAGLVPTFPVNTSTLNAGLEVSFHSRIPVCVMHLVVLTGLALGGAKPFPLLSVFLSLLCTWPALTSGLVVGNCSFCGPLDGTLGTQKVPGRGH